MSALPITSTRNAIVAKTVASEVKVNATMETSRPDEGEAAEFLGRKLTAIEQSSAAKARPQATGCGINWVCTGIEVMTTLGRGRFQLNWN